MKRSYRKGSSIKNSVSVEEFVRLHHFGKEVLLYLKHSPPLKLELIVAVSMLENLQVYFSKYPLDYVTKAACTGIATAEESPSNTEAAYTSATKYLYSRGPDPELPGATIAVPSPIHKNYLANQLAYQRAVSDYRRAVEEARTSSQAQQVWPVVASAFGVSVDQAQNDLISGGAEQVEIALDILNELRKGDVVDSRFVKSVASVNRSPTPPNVRLWLITTDAGQDTEGGLRGYAFTILDASAIKRELERIVGVIGS